MVGPNKQFDQTEALDKALQVFWDKGYEATSMQDLVSSMGINRASMYQTFGNKYALFNASIDRYIDNSTRLLQQLLDKPGSPLDNLQQLFMALIAQSLDGNQHGCLLNNTAVELAPHDADIALKLRQVWQQFEDTFASLIERAIEHDEIHQDVDAKQLGLLLNVQLQGLIIKTKTNTPRQSLHDSVDLIFKLIRQ